MFEASSSSSSSSGAGAVALAAAAAPVRGLVIVVVLEWKTEPGCPGGKCCSCPFQTRPSGRGDRSRAGCKGAAAAAMAEEEDEDDIPAWPPEHPDGTGDQALFWDESSLVYTYYLPGSIFAPPKPGSAPSTVVTTGACTVCGNGTPVFFAYIQ